MSFLNSVRLLTRNGSYFRSRLLLLPESISLCGARHSLYMRCLTYNVCSSHISTYNFSNKHLPRRTLSSDAKSTDSTPDDEEKNLTVFQRFTKVYKEYGKTLIAVHVVTSLVWYGGFYVIAQSGLDLMPWLIKFGASEAIQAKYSAAGSYVVAYILYEIAKPIRYLATLALTRQAVVYMRRIGYLPPIKAEDKLRNLAKDGRDNLKDKYQEQKVDMKIRYAKTKAVYQTRLRRYRSKHSNTHRPTGSHLSKTIGSSRYHKKVSETKPTKPSNKV